MATELPRAARRTSGQARRAVAHPWLVAAERAGYVARGVLYAGYLWSGFSYAVLVLFALQLFLGGSGVDINADTVQGFVAKLLRNPAGGALTIGAGLLAIGSGLVQFYEAYQAGFRKDLKRQEMSRQERKAADFLGRFGMFARGVTFLVVGWFLIQAGMHHDPSQAHGYSGAFVFLLNQPFGPWLLGITAAGFVALGLQSFAYARWVRLMGARG